MNVKGSSNTRRSFLQSRDLCTWIETLLGKHCAIPSGISIPVRVYNSKQRYMGATVPREERDSPVFVILSNAKFLYNETVWFGSVSCPCYWNQNQQLNRSINQRKYNIITTKGWNKFFAIYEKAQSLQRQTLSKLYLIISLLINPHEDLWFSFHPWTKVSFSRCKISKSWKATLFVPVYLSWRTKIQ